MSACTGALADERGSIRCDRLAGHLNKPHRSTQSWMTTDGEMVEVTLQWRGESE